MTKKNVNTSYKVTEAVEEFRSFFKKSVLDVLEMGRVVSRVKAELQAAQFEDFCKGIGYTHKSSSIKKLKLIGDKHQVLAKFASSLPSNWTSLYEITKLNEAQIAAYVTSGAIHTQVKGSEIAALNGKESFNRKEEKVSNVKLEEVLSGTRGCAFVCQLVDVNDIALKAKIQKFVAELKQQKTKVKILESKDFKSILQSDLKQAA